MGVVVSFFPVGHGREAVNSPLHSLPNDALLMLKVGVMRHAFHLFFDKVVDVFPVVAGAVHRRL